MKDIYIVCAGGFGREVYHLICEINKSAVKDGKDPVYNIKGFLSDVTVELDKRYIHADIVGKIQDWEPQNDEVYAIGIADPDAKERLTTLLKSKGASFETLISPRAYIPDDAIIGEGCILNPYYMDHGVEIGNFVNIMGSALGEGCVIGDYSTTTAFANLTNAQIGKNVFIGSHAVIMNKKKIGDKAFVCVNSVVYNNVKAGMKVFGNPAKRIDW